MLTLSRVVILTVLFSVTALSTSAQTRIYYDELFKSKTEKKTEYFREFIDTDSGTLVREVCKDTLMAKGIIRPVGDRALINDFAHYVKSYGNPYQKKSDFDNLSAEIDYYRHGEKYCKFVARGAKVLFAQQWSPDGEPLLQNGNGIHKYSRKSSSFHQLFEDSVMTEMYEVRHLQADTLYLTYDQMAEPKNGYKEFTEDLVKILKYPGFARLMGKEGVVYVRFIIDKQGNMTEFKPLSHEGFNLEKRAVEQLAKMPRWKPAVFRGKPVKMPFTIPIRFRLI